MSQEVAPPYSAPLRPAVNDQPAAAAQEGPADTDWSALAANPHASPDARDTLLLGRIRHATYAVLAFLCATVAVSVWRAPVDGVTLAQVLATLVLAGCVAAQHEFGRRLGQRRAAREAGITRMLQGMSRSVSSDAIVQTIVDELRGAADADHILVARLRPVDRVVEATLVSSRARVPPSRSTLPASVLDPARVPGAPRGGRGPTLLGRPPEQLVADDLARRLAESYALSNTLAMPLVADDRILGALILSRRQRRDWTAGDRRLLSWAAQEMSAALARAFAFEEVENQANVDALTGLPNRRYLEELLATVGPRRRSVDRLGVLMIDLDNFKRLNDRYGHAVGDRVLRAVGERIANAVRADDTPARYGGEEFAVVLRRASPAQALEVAERIRAQVEAIGPDQLGIEERITVSVGVAVADIRAGEVPILLEAADDALYRAKREGRNRVVLAA